MSSITDTIAPSTELLSTVLTPVVGVSTQDPVPSPPPLTCIRGSWDQIVSMAGAGAADPDALIEAFADALPELGIESYKLSGRAKRVHGQRGWTAVCGFRRFRRLTQRFTATTPVQGVLIVQIRQAGTGRYGIEIQKTYALIGRTESGSPFRHPVSWASVRGAIRGDPMDPTHVVRRVQCWMWQCTMRQLLAALENGGRQGDVLMVQVAKPRGAERVETREIILGESHKILSSALYEEGSYENRIIALNPSVVHLKNQHDPIFAQQEGYYSIRLAREERAWNVGQRVGD